MLPPLPKLHQLDRSKPNNLRVAGDSLRLSARAEPAPTPPILRLRPPRRTSLRIAARGSDASQTPLLNLNSSASFRELLLNGLRFFLGDTFLDALGGAVDQILGFFQAEAGHFADSLDYIDLIGADVLQDDGKLGLFLGRSRCRRTAAARHHHRSCCRGRNTELLFEPLYQSRRVKQRQIYDLIFQLLQVCHCLFLQSELSVC